MVKANQMQKEADHMEKDTDLIQERAKLSRKYLGNPDTEAWHDQRQKIALAIGDRVFEKDFDRVFDSLTLAVSSLELKVNNMERQSGYIAASGISLPPNEAKALQRAALRDWCTQSGFDPAILDRPYTSSRLKDRDAPGDTDDIMAGYAKMRKALNFQLIKSAGTRTKVKLRFSEVYYPKEIEAYYKLVWQAVDKQIFIDQNIEGTVEKRQ
jgi:hypothetical protein